MPTRHNASGRRNKQRIVFGSLLRTSIRFARHTWMLVAAETNYVLSTCGSPSGFFVLLSLHFVFRHLQFLGMAVKLVCARQSTPRTDQASEYPYLTIAACAAMLQCILQALCCNTAAALESCTHRGATLRRPTPTQHHLPATFFLSQSP